MQSRFALRIESGDHAGEIVPLDGPSVTIGRRPGNTFRLGDTSVSGQHAEFRVTDDAVVLRDLGSTNGTKVGARDVADGQALAHGDEILLGHVRLRFEDTAFGGAAPPADFPRAAGADAVAGELAQTQVHQISAEKVERSSKRSILALVVVAVLAGGGGAAWFFLRGGGGSTGPTARPVVPVSGDLLSESYSFELAEDGTGTADPGWETADDAPAGFLVSPTAAASGESGLHAPLAGGEWVEHRSPWCDVGGAVEVQAALAATGSARVRLGIEFSTDAGGAHPMRTWSPPFTGELEPRFLRSDVPAGYDRARVLVRGSASGSGGGDVMLDDVSLVTTDALGAERVSGSYRLAVAGDPGDAASLFKINRLLLSSIRVERHEGERATLSATPHAVGLALATSGGERFHAIVENPLVGRVGTVGEGGYRTHRGGFEAEGVTGLLCGEGVDLLRIRFGEPVRVTGRPDGDGLAISAEGLPSDGGQRASFAEIVLQVDFDAERREADEKARDAREAERRGELGPALAIWESLSDVPYEDEVYREASEARARLLQEGQERLAAVRAENERAAFFGLPDLYRKSRAAVVETAEVFARSEIEAKARALIDTIDAELAELERDLYSAEIERLRSIQRMLESAAMPELAGRVSTYLSERYGVEGAR